MHWRRPSAAWSAALLAALASSWTLGRRAERRMVVLPVDGQRLYAQEADGEANPQGHQKIIKTPGKRLAAYSFLNFNQDRIEVSYGLPEPVFKKYDESFGYRKETLEEIKQFRENAVHSVYAMAVKDGRSQAQLDKAVANIDKEYKARVREYLGEQGFKLGADNVTSVDMPAIVRKNKVALAPLAAAFDRIAQDRRYRSPEIIGAALSFVQTALHYKVPDPVYKGKHTGGLLPPVTAVLLGWGDCDTKTAVLASILSNWAQMRMVGITVPGHYLMGVLLIPEKGDLFVEYGGLQYVLVEPAGPAWFPPGQVADTTAAELNGREGYNFEPFFQGDL